MRAPRNGVVYATAVEIETYEEARMDDMSAFQSSLYLSLEATRREETKAMEMVDALDQIKKHCRINGQMKINLMCGLYSKHAEQ